LEPRTHCTPPDQGATARRQTKEPPDAARPRSHRTPQDQGATGRRLTKEPLHAGSRRSDDGAIKNLKLNKCDNHE
ncbi:hypothetical protein PF004_g32477, partial [Phytophthora fragariae]